MVLRGGSGRPNGIGDSKQRRWPRWWWVVWAVAVASLGCGPTRLYPGPKRPKTEVVTAGGAAASPTQPPSQKWLSEPNKAPNELDYTLSDEEAELHDAIVAALGGKLIALAIEGTLPVPHVEDAGSAIAAISAAMAESADAVAMPELRAVDELVGQHREEPGAPVLEGVLRRLVMRSLFKRNVADNLTNAHELTSLVPKLHGSGVVDARLVRILIGSVGRVLGSEQARAFEATRDNLAKPYGGFPAGPKPQP